MLPLPYPTETPTPNLYSLGWGIYFDPSKVDWTAFGLDLVGMIGDVAVFAAPAGPAGPVIAGIGGFVSTATDIASVIHACRKAGIYGWDDFKKEMIGQGVKAADTVWVKRQAAAGIPGVGAAVDLVNLVDNLQQGVIYIDSTP